MSGRVCFLSQCRPLTGLPSGVLPMKLAPHGPPRYWGEDAAPGVEDSPALPGCALFAVVVVVGVVALFVVGVVEAAAVVWVSLPAAAPMEPAPAAFAFVAPAPRA